MCDGDAIGKLLQKIRGTPGRLELLTHKDSKKAMILRTYCRSIVFPNLTQISTNERERSEMPVVCLSHEDLTVSWFVLYISSYPLLGVMTIKHFAAYNVEANRMGFNAVVYVERCQSSTIDKIP